MEQTDEEKTEFDVMMRAMDLCKAMTAQIHRKDLKRYDLSPLSDYPLMQLVEIGEHAAKIVMSRHASLRDAAQTGD